MCGLSIVYLSYHLWEKFKDTCWGKSKAINPKRKSLGMDMFLRSLLIQTVENRDLLDL